MRRGGECKTLGEQEACMVSKSSLLQVIMELGALGKHHLSKFISTAQIENPSYLSFEKLSENNIALHNTNNIMSNIAKNANSAPIVIDFFYFEFKVSKIRDIERLNVSVS